MLFRSCRTCSIVDQDGERPRAGHLCRACGKPGNGGRLHFSINIHVLVDHMQSAYRATSPSYESSGPRGNDVGTVLYFCTLRESLVNHFLIDHLLAQRVAPPLISRLLDDNKHASQKFGALFSSVIGLKWKVAVGRASTAADVDFNPVSSLMERAAQARNEFLHQGTPWCIKAILSKDCGDSSARLVHLFAALHNEFTRPLRNNAQPLDHPPMRDGRRRTFGRLTHDRS